MFPNQQGQPQQNQPQPEQEDDQYVEAGAEGDDANEAPEIDPEEMQMLIFSRIAELSPEETQIFSSMVTPQTVGVLFKIMPELGPLLQEIVMAQQGQGGGMPQQGGQPMPQGAGAAPPQPRPMPQQAAPQQQQPQQAGIHPFLSDEVSKGLVG